MYGIVIIIFAIIIWVISRDASQLRERYFQQLLKDDDFTKYVENLIVQSPDKLQCVKEIRRKYPIGIGHAKRIVEDFSEARTISDIVG